MNSSPVTAITASSDTVQLPAASEHDPDYEHEPDHEYEHEHTRWAENAHRADEAPWPDSVANPRRTQVR